MDTENNLMKRYNSFPPRSPLGGLAVILLALLAATAACSPNGDSQVTTMPSFNLASAQDDSNISSRDLEDQALVVTFFATWCPPCRQEVPNLVALQEKYGNDDFTVLGISVDQGDTRAVRNFMSEMEINYPVVMSDTDTPKNFGDVFGVPTSFLIDHQGEIIQRFDGHVDLPVLERELQAIL